MNSATKRAALEAVTQTIAKPLQQSANAVDVLILMIVLVAPGPVNKHSVFSQKLIARPFELSALDPNAAEFLLTSCHSRFTLIFRGRSPHNYVDSLIKNSYKRSYFKLFG